MADCAGNRAVWLGVRCGCVGTRLGVGAGGAGLLAGVGACVGTGCDERVTAWDRVWRGVCAGVAACWAGVWAEVCAGMGGEEGERERGAAASSTRTTSLNDTRLMRREGGAACL